MLWGRPGGERGAGGRRRSRRSATGGRISSDFWREDGGFGGGRPWRGRYYFWTICTRLRGWRKGPIFFGGGRPFCGSVLWVVFLWLFKAEGHWNLACWRVGSDRRGKGVVEREGRRVYSQSASVGESGGGGGRRFGFFWKWSGPPREPASRGTPFCLTFFFFLRVACWNLVGFGLGVLLPRCR